MPERIELLPWYLMDGDGSERCLICGTRDFFRSFYVRVETLIGDERRHCSFPICGYYHARDWVAYLTRVAHGDEDAECTVLGILYAAERPV